MDLIDIEKATVISKENHRYFFHSFVSYGSTFLFCRHVHLSSTIQDVTEHEHLFAIVGMYGCIGSTDSTDVPLQTCARWASINHVGSEFKCPQKDTM